MAFNVLRMRMREHSLVLCVQSNLYYYITVDLVATRLCRYTTHREQLVCIGMSCSFIAQTRPLFCCQVLTYIHTIVIIIVIDACISFMHTLNLFVYLTVA